MTNRWAQTENGFTLLEILVATTIIALAFSVLLPAAQQSYKGLLRNADLHHALRFQASKLDEIASVADINTTDLSGEFPRLLGRSISSLFQRQTVSPIPMGLFINSRLI